MVKADGHIDLVFRDGLKDLEVLPPSDLWDNISREVAPVRNNSIIFRAAAGIAAIVSLGMLSYFVGVKSTDSILNPYIVEFQQDATLNNLLTSENINLPEVAEALIPGREAPLEPAGGILADNESISDKLFEHTPVKTGIYPSDYMVAQERDNDIIRSGNSANEPEPLLTGVPTGTIESSLVDISYNDSKYSSRDKWMLGAKISPTYLSQNLKAANNSINEYADDETGVLSYSGGFSVIYSVGGRLSFQTGIYYSSLGRQISDINSFTGYSEYSNTKGGKIFGVETSSGIIASTNSDVYLTDVSSNRISSLYSTGSFDPAKASLDQFGNSLQQNFEYLEVPLLLSYKLIDRRVDFNIMGGVSYSFLLNNVVYAVSEGSKVPIGTTEDITSLLLSSSLGMSMHYSLNDRFSLNFEPSFRYYLNSDGRLTSNNPYTFGFFSGVYYKF